MPNYPKPARVRKRLGYWRVQVWNPELGSYYELAAFRSGRRGYRGGWDLAIRLADLAVRW